MPRFSVIVPVYQAQAYLHACLESVLSQSYHGSGADRGRRLLAGRVRRDRRRVRGAGPAGASVHLPRNSGLGPARNAGLERATGDYLVFLDGDDTLDPGALHAIADRLKETGEPDVLVYDHARAHWSGGTVRDRHARQLTEQGPAPFRLADRPGLLRLLDGGLEQGVPPGLRRARGLHLPVRLLRGRRLDVPGPDERRGPSPPSTGSACTTGSAGTAQPWHHQPPPLRRLRAVRPGLRLPRRAPRTVRAWRPVLFRRMVDHVTEVFARAGRGCRAARAPRSCARARAHCRRHRSPGHPVPLRSRLRHALVRLGPHRTYRCLRRHGGCAERAGTAAVRWLRPTRGGALRLHYRVQLRLPLRADRAVFAAYGGRGHGCNPGALETAMRELVPQIRTAWIARPGHHHTIPTATRRLRPGTAAYWSALARSKYLVNNADFDRRLVKRPGQVFVQTQHGTPLKHMGLDLQERPAAARATDFDDLLSGRRQVGLRPVRQPPLHAGLGAGVPRPATRRWSTATRATTSSSGRRRPTSPGCARASASPQGAVAVLYAPTHRDYRRSQRTALDLERMLRGLGPRFVVLTRAHHRYGAPLTTAPAAGSSTSSDHPSVESLCLASDALVTDYSSLMFDYAGLDRPIVLHVDDWEAYEAARGTYFDLRAFPPGAVARSEDELTDIFATGHWRGSRSTQLRSAFRERFCPYDDGRAAERVVRHVVLGEDGWAAAGDAARRASPGAVGGGRVGRCAADHRAASRRRTRPSPKPSRGVPACRPARRIPPRPGRRPGARRVGRAPGHCWYRRELLDDELDLDVAAGGVGVGADLVGLLDELAAGLRVHRVGQLDAKGDLEAEALALLAYADLGGDGGVTDVHLGLAADETEGAAETGGVTGGEQLLRVGALPVAAQLHRRGQLQVDLAVVGDGATIAAVGGGGDCGVERVHGKPSLSKSCSGGFSFDRLTTSK